jgi:hypothetical protein
MFDIFSHFCIYTTFHIHLSPLFITLSILHLSFHALHTFIYLITFAHLVITHFMGPTHSHLLFITLLLMLLPSLSHLLFISLLLTSINITSLIHYKHLYESCSYIFKPLLSMVVIVIRLRV